MKLDEYLKREDMHATQFARKANISHQTVRHVIHGRDCRGSVFAKIQKFTRGEVSLMDYYP
jgi:predicted transcriptional regulator